MLFCSSFCQSASNIISLTSLFNFSSLLTVILYRFLTYSFSSVSPFLQHLASSSPNLLSVIDPLLAIILNLIFLEFIPPLSSLHYATSSSSKILSLHLLFKIQNYLLPSFLLSLTSSSESNIISLPPSFPSLSFHHP